MTPMATHTYKLMGSATGISKPHPRLQVAVPLLLTFTAGTGGAMTPQSAGVLAQWVYNPLVHVEHSVNKTVDARSPAEHVSNVRDAFFLNMSEVAAVFGVTRPTVYAWLDGQEPKTDAITHILRLSRIADELRKMNIPRMDTLVRRPMLNGQSLVDLLKAGKCPVDGLGALKAAAEKEANVRKTPKGSGKNKRSFDEVVAEFPSAYQERR